METLSHDDNPTDCYQYSSLPSARHIRLLQIQPRSRGPSPVPFHKDDDPINISVKIVCLDDDPKYDALSYTWGNPITVYQNEDEADHHLKLFQKPCQIVCDGKSLKVTRNLYDAFLAIRSIPSKGSYQIAHGSDRADYIWIDAICIHQQDIDERNSQVKIMNQIYANAQMTIIWLGRDDCYTRTAGKVLSQMHELTPEQAQSTRAYSFGMKSWTSGESALSQFDDADWLAVYAFFNRSWFMRVWTIQEVALAARSVILCGKVMLSWSQIVRICLAFDKSKMYERIEILAGQYKTKARQQSDHRDETSHPLSLYQTPVPSRFYPPRTIVGIAHVRAGLGIKDTYLTYASHLDVPDLTRLMALFRSSLTAESRDRVYGLIGLIPTDTIAPDYRKSVEAVYLDAICRHLEKAKNLTFLGDIQDLSRKSLKSLPSWVPDYTVEMFPQRFNNDPLGASHFDAANGFNFSYRLVVNPTPTLQLQGYVISFVEDVADFDVKCDLLDILDLLWDLPHLYKADVTHRADEITDGYSGTFDLKIEGGFLRGVEVQEEHESSEDFANEKKRLLPLPEDSKPWLVEARLQTHVEVLWRTLIADTWEGRHPAPVEAGFGFADAIIARMQHLCLEIQLLAAKASIEQPVPVNSSTAQDRSSLETALEQLFNAFSVLAESEFEGFTRAKDTRLVAEDGTVETLNSADPLVSNLPREKVSETLTQFLPIFEMFSDMLAHSIDMDRVTLWTRRFGQFMPGRKLFRTAPYQFLGSGPTSLEIGDAVCILAGGDVPYLLRKVDGLGDSRYSFIGEAYVHGMMHGEAKYLMDEEDQSLIDVILV